MSDLFTVEVDSNLIPGATVSDQDFIGGSGGGKPSIILQMIRPQFTVTTPFGTKVIAPYGTPIDWRLGLLILCGFLFGVGWTLARIAGRLRS